MKRIKESKKPVFNITDRGFNARAYYLKDIEESRGDALIELRYNRKIVRKMLYPAYKIWNIPAHFSEIVTSEINNDTIGYEIAGNTLLGGVIMPKEISST